MDLWVYYNYRLPIFSFWINGEIMDYTLWLGFIIAVVVFLSTPGPVTVMVASRATTHGLLPSIATIFGTNLASLVLIGISFLALFGVVGVNQDYLRVLTLFGSLYIAYFAYGIFKDSQTIHQLKLAQDDKKLSTIGYIKQGFLVGIANPKDILFFVGFFPLFFAVADDKLISAVILTLTWVVLDYGLLLLYAYLFAKIANDNFIKISMILSAVVLLLFACFGVISSLRDLL